MKRGNDGEYFHFRPMNGSSEKPNAEFDGQGAMNSCPFTRTHIVAATFRPSLMGQAPWSEVFAMEPSGSMLNHTIASPGSGIIVISKSGKIVPETVEN